MNQLWLIRHAKSSWADPGQADFDRPLNDRGRRAGPHMQAWLRRQKHPATWIWTSDAARALATAEYVREAFGLPPERVVAAHELYLASAEILLATLRATPQAERAVALVAHNPGLTSLVNLLAGRHELDNLPTFGVARFAVPDDWSALAFGQGELQKIVTPKSLN